MLSLFNHPVRRIFTAIPAVSRRYRHCFGGSVEEFGLQYRGSAVPLHLICLFDTTDPLWPIAWPDQWFPLCYGFAFDGAVTAYRVDQGTIEVLKPVGIPHNPDFPDENFPAAFPRQELSLRRVPYDPRNADDALMNSAFFGLEHVPVRTLTKIAARLDEWGGLDDVDLAGQSREQYLRKNPYQMPLLQGVPDTACVNSHCPAHRQRGAMQIIAVHFGDELEGTSLWGSTRETIQLIFQLCDQCRTIVVSNQCT